MAEVKFGTGQLGNPTPAKLERNVKIFIGVCGLILAWMPTNNIVPKNVQDIITPIANLINSILIFMLPYFGVQVDRKTVPVEDVKVMETKNP
jgi:hypothetical protein